MQETWLDRPMRICAFQWSLGEKTFDAPDAVAGGQFNVEQLCHIMAEHTLTEIYEPDKHAERLERYVQASKKHGTRLILYFNAHCVFPAVIGRHPDWAQVGPDGQPARAYGTYLFTCVNSPWRDVFLKSTREVMRHALDGLFLDGPIYTETTCECPSCRAGFLAEYGHGMDEATPRERNAFKVSSLARFVKDVRDAMKSVRPEAVVYTNNVGLAQNVTGCTIDGMFPYVDLIGTEGGFMFYDDPDRTTIWKGLQSSNYLESKSRGKPYVIFSAGNHCSWARSMHSPEESELLFASAVCNGANVWYGVHGPTPMLDTRGGRAGLALNRFLAANERYYAKTHRRAEAAILWSSQTLDNFPEDVDQSDFTQKATLSDVYAHGRFTQEFKAFLDLLFRRHLQVAIHDEASLALEDLSRYKLLVLPNDACLDQASADRIAKYVEGGGTVVASMATSFFDENGVRRARPALADVFGIASVGETVSYNDGCGYLAIGDEALRKAGGLAALTGGFSHAFRCEFTGAAVPLGAQYVPMAGSYDEFPDEKYTAFVRTSYGKGTCFYFAGDIGATVTNHGLVELKRLVKHVCGAAYDAELQVEGAFESLAVTLREQREEKRRLVHFVNYTGQMRRPIEESIPCRDVVVTLKTDGPAASVSLLRAGTALPFERTSDGIRFTVPVVDLYEVAAVQLA